MFRKIKESSFLCDEKRAGRPGPPAERVACVGDAFGQSPRKSIRQASAQLQFPEKRIWSIARKNQQM